MKLFCPPELTGHYLRGVLHRRWLTTGPACEALIRALADFHQVEPERIVLGSSATACWQGIFDLIRDRRGHYPAIYMTEATWPGMHQVHDITGHYCTDYARDPSEPPLAEVIVLTDIGGGRLAPMDEARGLSAESRAAYIVHDACHSWLLDPKADFTLFSFYPTKLVPGAEGGCVVTKHAADAQELRLRLYCGMQPGSAGKGIRPALIGRKANMTDVTAALNLEALDLSHQYMAKTALAHARLATFARSYQVPYRNQPLRPYLFQVEMPAERVPAAMEFMKLRGIPTAWNFPPAGLLTVPCHEDISDSDCDHIFTSLRTFDREAPSPRQAPRPPASPLDPK